MKFILTESPCPVCFNVCMGVNFHKYKCKHQIVCSVYWFTFFVKTLHCKTINYAQIIRSLESTTQIDFILIFFGRKALNLLIL